MVLFQLLIVGNFVRAELLLIILMVCYMYISVCYGLKRDRLVDPLLRTMESTWKNHVPYTCTCISDLSFMPNNCMKCFYVDKTIGTCNR